MIAGKMGAAFRNVVTAFVICAVLPMAANAARRSSVSTPVLRALVVTPEPSADPARGIAQLLNSHRIETEVVSWKEASNSLASRYDVLVVSGRSRTLGSGDVRKSDVNLSFRKPVLAVGPYGCKYLGLLDLKNGWPYT